jgi:hypothetical protein
MRGWILSAVAATALWVPMSGGAADKAPAAAGTSLADALTLLQSHRFGRFLN